MINSTNFHRTYTAHANAIILSEELLISKGIKDFIDYFERTPEIRRNTWLLVSGKGQFERIFNSSINVEAGNDIGKVIKGIIENKSRVAFITANTLGDFLNLYWETGSQPYTSGISVIETGVDSGTQTAGSNMQKDYDICIENTVVFKKDYIAGWLNNEESRGLLWVLGGIKGGSVPIRYDEKEVLVQIAKENSDIKPLMKDGKIQINVTVKVLANIEESQAKLVYANKQVDEKIEGLLSEEIKKQINAALYKSKQLDVDVFGFGNYIFGSYPKEWKLIEKNAENYYRNLSVNINVDSILNQVGLVKENQRY
jgi:spore germination protein KC